MKPKPEEQSAAEQEFYDRKELVMDDEDAHRADLRRFALTRMDEFWLRGLRLLVVQKKVRCLSFDCYLLAIGQGCIIGIEKASEVAKLYNVTKAAASECVDDFRQALKIELMPGQRDSDGRKEMAKARDGKLKK